MADKPQNGKEHVAGKVPPDDYHRFTELTETWGVTNSDAFRRVFSAGLDAAETKYRSLTDYISIAVLNLAVIGIVMYLLGVTMPNIPTHSATLAAMITFTVAGGLIAILGIIRYNNTTSSKSRVEADA